MRKEIRNLRDQLQYKTESPEQFMVALGRLAEEIKTVRDLDDAGRTVQTFFSFKLKADGRPITLIWDSAYQVFPNGDAPAENLTEWDAEVEMIR